MGTNTGTPTRPLSGATPPVARPYAYYGYRVGWDGRPHRGSVLWPLLLILAGGVLLLNNLGYLDWHIWADVWRLWPLVLVIIGLDILLGRRRPVLSALIGLTLLGAAIAFLYTVGGFQTPASASLAQVPLDVPVRQADSTRVYIDFGTGNLTVDSMREGGASLVTGILEYPQGSPAPQPQINIADQTYEVHLRQAEWGGSGWWSLFWHNPNPDWSLRLNPRVSMDLNIDVGASRADLNLKDLKVGRLDLNLGAGDTTVTFPAEAGSTTATINAGVAHSELIIPPGVGARIKVSSSPVAELDIGSSFVKKGDDLYETQSPGYEQAANKLDIDLNVGAARVTITSATDKSKSTK